MEKNRKNRVVIEFPQTKNRQFAMYVNSEIMSELAEGLIDPQLVFSLLTNEGKARVMARFT